MNPFDDVIKKVSQVLPENLKHMQADFEDNMRGILQSQLAKADLVTREEFDVQKAVLLKTREKVDALEVRIRHLETQLGDDPSS